MKQRNQILKDAFRKIGALGENETLSTAQIDAGASALSSLIKAQVANGMQIWKIEQVSYALTTQTTGTATVGVGKDIVTTSVPLKLVGAWREYDDIRTPLLIYTRQEFMDIPQMLSDGAPLAVYYQPMKTDGVLGIWPVPDTSWQANGNLILDFQIQFTDPVLGTDVLDFPDHWEQTIIYLLAQRLAPEYGVPINERNLLTQDSERFKIESLSFDNEEGSIFIRPTGRRR